MIRKFGVAIISIFFFVGVIFCTPIPSSAGDITGTGVSQADLVAIITALTAAVNELKSEVNSLSAALDASFTTVIAQDNTAALDNTLSSSYPVGFTTIVLSPRAGY